jgi:HNH endonuclease.
MDKGSKAFRSMHPLCKICEEKGILTPSEVTDHIIPVAICEDFWNQNNWQALCKKCNVKKGNRDKKLIEEYRKNERKNTIEKLSSV